MSPLAQAIADASAVVDSLGGSAQVVRGILLTLLGAQLLYNVGKVLFKIARDSSGA